MDDRTPAQDEARRRFPPCMSSSSSDILTSTRRSWRSSVRASAQQRPGGQRRAERGAGYLTVAAAAPVCKNTWCFWPETQVDSRLTDRFASFCLKSIWDELEQLNLDPFQSKQADTKRKNADDTVNVRIPEAYQWLLVPNQPDP